MWDVFLLLVHNLILRPLVSDVYLKIWAPAGTWCVSVSVHLILLNINFLAITDRSMKIPPVSLYPSSKPKGKGKWNKCYYVRPFLHWGANSQFGTLEAGRFSSLGSWIAACGGVAPISAWEWANCGRWWTRKMTFVRLSFSRVESPSWAGWLSRPRDGPGCSGLVQTLLQRAALQWSWGSRSQFSSFQSLQNDLKNKFCLTWDRTSHLTVVQDMEMR